MSSTTATTSFEWGPAKHDPSHPSSAAARQSTLDLWDRRGARPDDN